MATAVPNFLEGPTYIAISRYPDGETWLNETKLNASLEDAVDDVDNTAQVLMLENGKCLDVSVEAAEKWWDLNRHTCETTFDVPAFIHENYPDAYSDLQESRYEARAYHSHVQSCGRV